VFVDRLLAGVFGPKSDEVAGRWRKLHGEKLQNVYSSPDISGMITSRRMRWEGHVGLTGAMKSTYKILVGKPEGKTPRPICRQQDNVKIDFN
jgi:hypothetical protein